MRREGGGVILYVFMETIKGDKVVLLSYSGSPGSSVG